MGIAVFYKAREAKKKAFDPELASLLGIISTID